MPGRMAGSGYSGPPKLVVFGGRGFVGSHVCAEAVRQALGVVAISRAGTPPLSREPWVGGVTWARGNALEPQTFLPHLEGAEAVVSCIGGFGTQEEMLRVMRGGVVVLTNGAANVAVIEAALAAGVKRFVLISAHIPNIPGIESVLGGYVHGKRQAEDALRAAFPTTGVALRPSIIYGDRAVSQGLTLPLGLLFQPVEGLIERLGPRARAVAEGVPFLGAALLPPVSVQAVARAAVRAATDLAVPGGVIDVWELSASYKG
ncbi:hypothetical protein TSOC_008651 [Tetrabaena socialis]|uniref:NAD(P)-binding domain-containing protein n=1 Tax=Tetrabaena socialis TaxID=47790 RepID=A0A2J7ZXY8_9CHLO|nr:hypothetical protein TSOC_008651 [Tetrabaena socialis]|eukprot:PNH05125.1 hypothetical protein TSOC_008651 [Tetrabaena socialis]